MALSERVYYLPGSVNVAVVIAEVNQAIIVDSGQDKNHGRRIARACQASKLRPIAIVNTHAHADHFGGNDYLARNLGLRVYAPPFEASLMESPYLEPVYLFGGARPLTELESKWLLAKPSPVDHLLNPGTLELAGIKIEIIDTSGHAHVHYALKVDDVLIAADAVFGESALKKYPLPFGQDIERQIASAEKLLDTNARILLPGHGEPTEEIEKLIKRNLETFRHAAEVVFQACQGVTTPEVLERCCNALEIEITDLPRYYLNHCTVLAYLSYLRAQGRIGAQLKENRLIWSG